MFGTGTGKKTRHIGFLLVPEFSMISYASGLEPLRLANRVSDDTLYSGATYSVDGEPVTGYNGTAVLVDGALSDAEDLDFVFVCSGVNAHKYCYKKILTQLRRMSSHGTGIGALCTGTHILAKAGLLDGYRCTIHWEDFSSFTEEFPGIELTSKLFEIDRNRFTCAGGTSSVDLMLNLIALQVGSNIAAMVADEMIHHRIRDGNEAQRMELRSRLGVHHPKLLAVIQLMEENLEETLSCAGLAARVGLSTRQLERLFSKYLDSTPTRYYVELRLNRARFLLRQTSLPILSVALASGFITASHFSKCYREHFNRTPSEERRTAA